MRYAAICCLALAGPGAAQVAPQIDCLAEDLPAPEVRFCAVQAFEAADAELSEVYRLALTRAKVFDEQTLEGGYEAPMTLEEALRQAQQDWLTYRDSECGTRSLVYRGAAGAPVAGTLCRAEKTVARSEELRGVASEF